MDTQPINNQTITVYTYSSNPLTKEFWKFLVKKMIGKYSGPDAVRDSLLRGLRLQKVSLKLNPLFSPTETVLVLSGIKALANAIKLKKTGKIKRLIAGPNLVIKPTDANKVLCDSAIDYILVPSQWVADAYGSQAPDIVNRIVVWPAGVAEAPASTRVGDVIILNKRSDTTISQSSKKLVGDHGYNSHIFNYGNFSHDDYLNSLSSTRAVIYIASSESQGLAMQEAWMRNVPTFVYFTGVSDKNYVEWADEKINAPYLTNDFGGFFANMEELDVLLNKIDSYKPAVLCQKTLSDKASVSLLLSKIYYDIR